MRRPSYPPLSRETSRVKGGKAGEVEVEEEEDRPSEESGQREGERGRNGRGVVKRRLYIDADKTSVQLTVSNHGQG
jgi:hypothetical protein